MIDDVEFAPIGLSHIVAHHLEISPREERRDRFLPPGKVIVEADHLVATSDERLAEVGSYESGRTGHKHARFCAHSAAAICPLARASNNNWRNLIAGETAAAVSSPISPT